MSETEDTIVTWNWYYLLLAVCAAASAAGIGWITFNTVVNYLQIAFITAGFSGISFLFGYVFLKKKSGGVSNKLIWFCLLGAGPVLCFVFFALNNVFSSSEKLIEKFAIQSIQTQRDEKNLGTKSIVSIQDNKYNEYRGIRTFYNHTFSEQDKFIVFTFKHGLFGFKQLEQTTFAKD